MTPRRHEDLAMHAASPRRRTGAACATLVALLVLLAPAPAPAAIDICQKAIQKDGAKLDKLIIKTFQKCSDFYRKAVLLGTPLADAAASCQVQLGRSILFPDGSNASAMQQTKNALAVLTSFNPPLCTDDDLLRLGHLPQATFGDRWQRWILIEKLAGAYTQQLALVRDTPAIFRALAAAGGCPLCAKIASPPCFEQACSLALGSAAKLYAPALFNVALSGEAVLEVCRYDDVLPNDYAVLGTPGKTVNRSSVLTTNVCIRTVGAEGYVSCAGSSSPKISYTACEDHIINAPDIDECAGLGVMCQPSSPDLLPEHAGSTNGGSCLSLSSTASAAGAGFVLSSVEIGLVTAADRGPDGIACTDDDTGPPPLAITVPLTTATAQAFVFDGANAAGNNFSSPAATGTALSCTNVQAGILTGAQLVGALPALHTLCLAQPCDDPTTVADEGNVPADAAINFTLVCQ